VTEGALEGRVALVTGGSRNIGLAIARRFAAAGADLVITARTPETLTAVAADIRATTGRRVLAVAGDAAEPDDIDRLASRALEEFGGVDVVVNNALTSVGSTDSVLDADDAVWEASMRGYVQGPLRLLRRLMPSITARGHGSVINIVSTAGFVPIAGLAPYGVMKAAMWSLTRYLASDLAPEVRVNALCPGTTSQDGGIYKEGWRALLPLVPMARMGTAGESAGAALFLASDAASYTTGQVIFTDGGRVGLAGSRPVL
jgi:NAD(P)-dependent dehydrogenase (short-subunit alcohol dehydrogenase family)